MTKDEVAECVENMAHGAYQTYGKSTNFKDFQGNPMPTWEQLPVTIQEAWRNAVLSVVREFAHNMNKLAMSNLRTASGG